MFFIFICSWVVLLCFKMYDFFYNYFDDVSNSKTLKVSSSEGLDENNEIFFESIPPMTSSTSFTTNLYNRVISWLPMYDIVCSIKPIWFSQPLTTLKGCPSQQPIITLKGVPQDDKSLVFLKRKPNYTSVAHTYRTQNNPQPNIPVAPTPYQLVLPQAPHLPSSFGKEYDLVG